MRNLISQKPMSAGKQTVWWDGLDDMGRDTDAAKHSVFYILGRIVEPGQYTVRGLVHPEIDLVYRMTPYTNGLFVARLFEDCRRAAWDAPMAIPGMVVNKMSLHEECFGPTWTATDEGKVYLQAYFTGNIIEVTNFDKIHRLPNQILNMSRDQLLAAMQANIAAEAKRQKTSVKKVSTLATPIRKQAPVIDGSADDWNKAEWVQIDKRKAQVGNWGKRDIEPRANAAISNGNLYLVWQTYDKRRLNRPDHL